MYIEQLIGGTLYWDDTLETAYPDDLVDDGAGDVVVDLLVLQAGLHQRRALV